MSISTSPIRSAPAPSCWREWRRSSRIVLERNPRSRQRVYGRAEPNADDPAGQAMAWGASKAAACRCSIAWRSRGRGNSGRAGSRSSTKRTTHETCPAFKTRRCRMASWRQPRSSAAPRAARAGLDRTTTSTTTWRIRWSAATRRSGSRCAARSASRSTWTRRSSCLPRRDPANSDPAGNPRLRPIRTSGRTQSRAGEGAARPLRVCRP